jgi:hypothetical protein
VNCNQELCIEFVSVVNFHCETEPANLLQYFNLEKRKTSGTFGVPNRICRDIGIEIFKIHKTGTVPGKSGRMGTLFLS